MQSVEEYIQQYLAIVQGAVPNEQVLAVGLLSRAGSMGSVLASSVSGVAGLAMRQRGKSASGGLPQNVVVGVTPTRLVAFEYKPKRSSIELKGMVGEWTRQGLQVSGERNKLATRLTFAWPNGAQIELDSNRSVGQYNQLNDGFLAAVGCTVTG